MKINLLGNKHITGNVLDAKGIIVQQVNCKGVMGAGLAKQIKDKYPIVFPTYRKVYREHGSKALGGTQIVKVEEGVYIANLFAQDGYGRERNTVYTNYNALKSSLSKVANIAREHKLPVAIPYKLGCGLAGGDWNKVQHIIKELFVDVDYKIYKLN